jgi:hypothetical protein
MGWNVKLVGLENDSLITIYSSENRTATLSLNALELLSQPTLEITCNGVHLARDCRAHGFVNVSVPMHLAKVKTPYACMCP